MRRPANTIETILAKIVKIYDENSCWEYDGKLCDGRYCEALLNKKVVLIHRIAYEYTYDISLGRRFVYRVCKNPRCARPSHLTTIEPDDIKFWKNIDKNGPIIYPDLEACWVWVGKNRNRYGYGTISTSEGVKQAHRFSWELHNGPIPEGIYVLHRCDNPPCCHPGHLELGSPLKNARDAVDRGRFHTGDSHWTRRMPERLLRGNDNWFKHHPPGSAENKGSAILTLDTVMEIRSLFSSGLTRRNVADSLNVNYQTVCHIVSGRTWKIIR